MQFDPESHYEPKNFEPISSNQELNRLLCLLKKEGGVIGIVAVNEKSTLKTFGRCILNGIGRGIGWAIGTGFVMALIYKVLSLVIDINIPIIADLVKQLLQMLKGV